MPAAIWLPTKPVATLISVAGRVWSMTNIAAPVWLFWSLPAAWLSLTVLTNCPATELSTSRIDEARCAPSTRPPSVPPPGVICVFSIPTVMLKAILPVSSRA